MKPFSVRASGGQCEGSVHVQAVCSADCGHTCPSQHFERSENSSIVVIPANQSPWHGWSIRFSHVGGGDDGGGGEGGCPGGGDGGGDGDGGGGAGGDGIAGGGGDGESGGGVCGDGGGSGLSGAGGGDGDAGGGETGTMPNVPPRPGTLVSWYATSMARRRVPLLMVEGSASPGWSATMPSGGLKYETLPAGVCAHSVWHVVPSGVPTPPV
jgi:hypothetical protein